MGWFVLIGGLIGFLSVYLLICLFVCFFFQHAGVVFLFGWVGFGLVWFWCGLVCLVGLVGGLIGFLYVLIC